MAVKRKPRSIFIQLIGGYAAIALILVALSLYAVNRLNAVGGYFDTAYNQAVVPLEELARFKLTVWEIKSLLNAHVAQVDAEKQRAIEAELAQTFTAAEALLKQQGLEAIPREELSRVGEELPKDASYSAGDFREASRLRLLALLQVYWDKVVRISQVAVDQSNKFMVAEAHATLNTGAGLEGFTMLHKITSAILQQAKQEVVEYWAETWSQHGNHHEPSHEAGTGLDLGVDWYRDILRAKLVSLRIPKRLLVAYRDEVLRVIRQFEEEFNRRTTG